MYACVCLDVVIVFCFKQKTAYEMRISDWSSDVCSFDLAMQAATLARREDRPSASSSPRQTASSSAPKTTKSLALQFTPLSSNRIATSGSSHSAYALLQSAIRQCFTPRAPPSPRDRKRVVSGKSVSVRVDSGGGGR